MYLHIHLYVVVIFASYVHAHMRIVHGEGSLDATTQGHIGRDKVAE